MKHLVLLSLIGLCSLTYAQQCSYTLSGVVIDLHDQNPLAGATIVLAGSEQVFTTNDQGEYRIPGLCEATYTFQISHPACNVQTIRIAIKGDTERNINMEHHLEELGEVEIEGARNRELSTTAPVVQLEADAIDLNSSGSIGDALKNISGVSSLNTGTTIVKPVIQGLHSSRITLINKGTRIQDQEWGEEHAPNVDLNTAGSVRVIKGASGLQFGGDAVGGTIILDAPKIPVIDTLYGYTLLSGATNGRGGSSTTNVTKSFNNGWFGAAQGTLKRFGDVEAPDYILSNTALYERDFSLRLGVNRYRYGIEANFEWYRTDIGILRASHLGSTQDLVSALNSNVPLFIEPFTYGLESPRQAVTHTTLRIKGFKRFENFGKLDVQYDFQQNERLEFDIRRSDERDDIPAIDLELTTHTLIADFDYTADNTVTAKAGVLARFQDNFADPNTGVRRIIPDYERYDLGLYLIGGKNWKNWDIEAGIRYDFNHIDALKFYRTSFWEQRGYDVLFADIVVDDLGTQILANPVFDFHNVSATAGVRHNFKKGYALSGNYALSSRAPNPAELFSEGLQQSAAQFQLGSLTFDQETSNKVSVTFERSEDIWSFNITPYANFVDDFLLLEPTNIITTLRGAFQVWEYRQTQARLLGIDWNTEVRLHKNVVFNNQFSIVKGQDISLDRALIDIPAANLRNGITFSKPEWKNLKVYVESYFVFEQNEFPDNNFEAFIPQTQSTVLVDISTPPPSYHLINVQTGIDFNVFNASVLHLALNINNIFDTSYREYLNSFRFYADEPGRNIQLQVKINY